MMVPFIDYSMLSSCVSRKIALTHEVLNTFKMSDSRRGGGYDKDSLYLVMFGGLYINLSDARMQSVSEFGVTRTTSDHFREIED